MRLILATGNPKKGRELQELVGDAFDVVTLGAIGLGDLDIVEDADTFAGNAEIKVRAVHDALRARGESLEDVRAIVGDDSGIVVDALDGAPGIRSARFAADHDAGAGDEANNALLFRLLEDTPDAERTARFYCAIAILSPSDGAVDHVDGAVEGRIARTERGSGGFGYDPLFLPDEFPGRHMAELTAAEKHSISHRGKAMRKALALLG
jgi:XTP/dITP diphosphohydrolase